MKNKFKDQLIFRWVACLITLLASFLITQSSLQQSPTIDEPNHLACGMEWLQYNRYTMWPENPPLSRATVAIGPYLNGYRINPPPKDYKNLFDQFISSYQFTYFKGGSIDSKLFLMRIFVLPFFILSVWVIWLWGKSIGNEYTALLAVAIYSFLPTIMAHSGLATTDISFMATFILMLWLYTRWLKRTTYVNALWLGISMAICLVTKFSVLVFFPMCGAVLSISWIVFGIPQSGFTLREWFAKALKSGMVAVVVTIICWWGFFGFDVGYLGDEPAIAVGVKEGVFDQSIASIWVPAPEWFAGLKLLIKHHHDGALVFVNGNISVKGVWYFYALASALKTPWPYMFFLLIGAIGAFKRIETKLNWEGVALVILPFVILLMGFFSTINYGMRHILIVYPLGAIGGSAGIFSLICMPSKFSIVLKKAVLPIVVACELGIAIVAFPDYISYFNVLGGDEPGQYVNDSDLDWGQGVVDLAKFSSKHNIDTLWLSYQGLFQDCWYPELPVLKLLPKDSVVHGWIAVSEMHYRGCFHGVTEPMDSCSLYAFSFEPTKNFQPHTRYRWLDQYPLVGKVGGGSLRLYYVPVVK